MCVCIYMCVCVFVCARAYGSVCVCMCSKHQKVWILYISTLTY